MKVKIKYVAIALGLSLPVFSQSIERQVLASAGKEFAAANGSIEFTLGETVTQTMGDLSNGFHQPVFSITKVSEIPEVLGVTIFPNPTNGFIHVQFAIVQQQTKIELCDLSGKVLQVNSLNGFLQDINMSNYATGMYYLKINETQFYKIIKLQ
jgi:hypothetical protein